MASRSLLNGLRAGMMTSLHTPHTLRPLIRMSTAANQTFHPPAIASVPRTHPFHHSAFVSAETSPHGEADYSDHAETEALFRPPHEAVDATNAAFLGEGDSDDAFEADKVIDPKPDPALDAEHAAFLGEGDSNDAFEAQKEINPTPHEPLITSETAAFLGEGDSNDHVESEDAINPREPEPLDPSISGLHGQTGEQDHGDDFVAEQGVMGAGASATISEGDVKAVGGDEKMEEAVKRLSQLQGEVDDIKTLFGDREGVERDKFRL